MKKGANIILFSLAFITFGGFQFLFSSCEDAYSDIDCDYSDCNTVEPFEDVLIVTFTINDENPDVPFIVYEGNFEDQNIYLADTANSREWEVWVPLDKFYTIRAEYKSGSKKIFAIDGDKIKKNSSELCDSTCWNVTGGYIDVRLKY